MVPPVNSAKDSMCYRIISFLSIFSSFFFSLSLSYFKVADGVAESHPLLGNVEDHGLLVVGVSHKVDAPQPGVL